MLVAVELRFSAESLRAASFQARLLIDVTADHRGSLSASGLAGDAVDRGLDRLTQLGEAFADPAWRMEKVAGILESAAAVQEEIDAALQKLQQVQKVAAVGGAVGTAPLAPFPFSVIAAQRAAVAALALQARLLDQACAAAVDDACALSHEAELDRLVFHPDEPLDEISARHLESAPASVRDAVRQANGMILEAGSGEYGSGFTVLVGPPGAGAGADIADNPANITTLVAGVSSGEPDKLPRAISQAQRVAQETGGPVIVWQGYNPPPDLVKGAHPASARAGADDLAAFQMALDERFPDARKVVVGHSYGTVVSTRAAMDHGLFADELILAGSPGVPARNVDELHLLTDDPAGGRVTVADSPTDPILALRDGEDAAHGFNPADPSFGAERLHGIRGGHTDYFDSEAFVEGIGQAGRR